MLRTASDIKGYTLGASDGAVGAVSDLLFDDATWLVRWLVIDTGQVLPGRKVLLPPSALGHVNPVGHQLAVRLTMQQVKDSPDIDADAPVSRRMETSLYDYYDWSPYWSTGFFLGGFGYPGGLVGLPLSEAIAPSVPHDRAGDPHLRSVRELTGYHMHARDGEIGHIDDFLVEDGDWSLRYVVAATQNWWAGKKVLMSPRSIVSIEWAERRVNLDVDRQTIKDGPAYDPSTPIDRAYEAAFHRHYGQAATPTAGRVSA